LLKKVPVENASRYGIVATEPGGRILQFQEKPKIGEAVFNLANTGISIFEPAVLDSISSGVDDIGGQLFPALVRRGGAVRSGLTVPPGGYRLHFRIIGRRRGWRGARRNQWVSASRR
jgi:NDP-sugar pyrophosphorylase family protein